MSQTVDFRPVSGNHKCDNCGGVFKGVEMQSIKDFFERVEPGSIVPSGACPNCGALCYPVEEEEEEKDADNVPSSGMHEERGGS